MCRFSYVFSTCFICMVLLSCEVEKEQSDAPETLTGDIVPAPIGSEIYKKNCVSCHGMDGKLGFSGAKDLTKSILTIDEIEVQVTHGKGAMVGFEKLLSKEEIKTVAQYVYEFR